MFLETLCFRDKRKLSLWHVIAEVNTKVDMKRLTKDLGFNSGTLRFAPDEDLIRTMGITHFLSFLFLHTMAHIYPLVRMAVMTVIREESTA